MVKVYAAELSADYTASAEEIMSSARLEKYKRITDPALKNQCAAVAHLLKKANLEGEEHYDGAGKPCVNSGFISIAHSGNWALVALSKKAIGIDIEMRREIDAEAIASRAFTEQERQSGLDFFELWVKKESLLKKLGIGLKGLKADISGHSFLELKEFPGYAAAVCTDETEYQLEIIKKPQ